MTRNKIFSSDPPLNPIPDLALHIRPPNSAPPPSPPGGALSDGEGDSFFDIWRRGEVDGSAGGDDRTSRRRTELSLGNPSAAVGSSEAECLRRRSFGKMRNPRLIPRPIQAIPVCNDSSFPSSPLETTSYSPPCFSSQPHRAASSSSESHRGCGNVGVIRAQPCQFYKQQPWPPQGQYPVGGASDDGCFRSRFIPRLPGKRATRAPRMRWTSSLHARFVRAVDLLGGHESNSRKSETHPLPSSTLVPDFESSSSSSSSGATPKSVLELMDVKDLTLAHVKSHLQVQVCPKSLPVLLIFFLRPSLSFLRPRPVLYPPAQGPMSTVNLYF